jgi:uncharacterized protein YbjT (DUF2867 family)
MILITGATGTTGKELVRLLQARGVRARVMARDPKKLRAAGMEIVRGDFADAQSLDAALAGIERAFLLSAPDIRSVDLQGRFIEAARRAGAKHIVKLSSIAAALDSPCRLLRWHGEIEKLLEDSGIPHTNLRPSFFMQNLLMMAASIQAEGAFYAPSGTGKMGMIDVRDIAAVALRTLTENGHAGKTYTLTGAEALSHADAAEKLSRATGKPVKHVDVSPADFRAAMLGAGMPEWFADGLNELYAWVREGQAGTLTNTVAELAGTPPIRFDEFARDYAGAFR